MAKLLLRANRWLTRRYRAAVDRRDELATLHDEKRELTVRFELLSKVSALGNLDLEELLPKIAELSIHELADWSAVDVLGEDSIKRLYVGHRDPADAGLAAQLRLFAPWREGAGWPDLIAGRPLFFAEVSDEVIRTNAQNAELYELLRRIGVRSVIAVPLRVREATVAVMTFASTDESGRRYTRADLALAEELARRAASVIDRARLVAELQASDARFRIALMMARTSVYEHDRELRVRWQYNVPVGDVVLGKTDADLFPADLAEQLTALKRHVLETGEPFRGELRLLIEGRGIVMQSAFEPLRDERGAIIGILGASTDVTEQTRVREELAQAVTFREQLMGVLGHDLRNPLGAIVAAAALLRRRSDLSLPASVHVERIDRAARRMSEMIATLLDFTQIRFHGRLPIAIASSDLGEVAQGIVDELRAAHPDRTIELVIHGGARGRWDSARMGQVISNLVGNALVHGAPDEPVTVSIDVGGEELWLRVHNAGPQIAPELIPALFEPFRRGAGRDGTRLRGLGLGLFIVRQIVLAHGGDVSVESTATDGTTFIVCLPRRLGEAASAR
jgi:signal transduction histidine kinase